MSKKYMTIPNALSLSRLIFLPLLYLFILADHLTAFLIGYILIGATDFFDGLIARRFNMTSEIGKALDSIADLFFYISSAWFLYYLYPQYLAPNSVLLIMFFSLFFLSFVVSSVLLPKPVMMHTFLLRLNGVLVYLTVIFSQFTNTTLLIAAILVIYLVGFSEEIAIFIRYGDVDADTPSIMTLMRRNERTRHS